MPEAGALGSGCLWSSCVKQSPSCSWRRLQNGLCVPTSKVACDHTLSKHCPAPRHVVAMGAGSVWEPAVSSGLERASLPQACGGPWDRGCGG